MDKEEFVKKAKDLELPDELIQWQLSEGEKLRRLLQTKGAEFDWSMLPLDGLPDND